MDRQSPRIVRLVWGRVEVAGGQVFKDAILFPGGCGEWDWQECGTNHSPGIQPAAVESMLARGAATVVLSQGMQGRLQVAPETEQLLEVRGIPVHVARSAEAAQLYTQLREEGPVGALIHSTC